MTVDINEHFTHIIPCSVVTSWSLYLSQREDVWFRPMQEALLLKARYRVFLSVSLERPQSHDTEDVYHCAIPGCIQQIMYTIKTQNSENEETLRIIHTYMGYMLSFCGNLNGVII